MFYEEKITETTTTTPVEDEDEETITLTRPAAYALQRLAYVQGQQNMIDQMRAQLERESTSLKDLLVDFYKFDPVDLYEY